MTPEEIKSAITAWCSQGTGLQLVEDRTEAGSDFVLGLRAASQSSAGTVPVEVRLDQGGDRVRISSSAPGGGANDRIGSLLDSRPAAVRAEETGAGTVISGHVYTDGFSRQTFFTTVEEVAKTRGLVDGIGGRSATTNATEDLGSQRITGAVAASSLPTPSFASTNQPAYTPAYTPVSGQPAQQAQPAPATSAFAPTHTVPPQGMQAWAAPDPNGAVVATLGGGLPIQVTEVRGAWARVLCSNGWTGWVDGRIIGVAR